MGIDLVHDEVEKELLTVSMGGGECFTNGKFLVASVCLSEDRASMLSTTIYK